MRMEEDGVDNRCRDSGTDLLHHQAALDRDLGEPSTSAVELVVQQGLRVPVEGAGAAAHRATAAGRGAGSGPRARFGTGAVSVKPQNMSAMPISSPRYTSEVSPARERPVAAATTIAPDAIQTFARTRWRRAIERSEPPTRKSVPSELSAIAQRKACPPSTPFAGGSPLGTAASSCAWTGATRTDVIAALVATASAPRSASRPRRGNSSHAEPLPR
jgi:hypothetical protein